MEGVETGSRERADNTQAGFDGDVRSAGDGRVLDAFHGMEGGARGWRALGGGGRKRTRLHKMIRDGRLVLVQGLHVAFEVDVEELEDEIQSLLSMDNLQQSRQKEQHEHVESTSLQH